MKRYICIHGHFYQPPRENAWLESIETQESAYPYHDWNERITAECYAANAASRVMSDEETIDRIVNNYARISFNFGPTVLAWLKEAAPWVYQSILDGDAESKDRYGGHGSALAQCYNHLIMPLANTRDKKTQVLWGVRDFTSRFGRSPEGMWLPETAVDLETLDLLVDQGVQFTVLAPRQAARMREIGSKEWTDLDGGNVDPSRAYRLNLPSGRTINLFFYDGPISQGVAFEKLLDNGEYLARRLESGFQENRDWPQLVHIATDGETYGHHHRRGDMALAYALNFIEKENIATLTNYGQYLETHPPTHEVEIHEDSSWSCVHGVERWRADCGCNSGMHPGWHQRWRAPLRQALDLLRDRAAAVFEERAAKWLRDPWAARDDYIDVILDRSISNLNRFWTKHAVGPLTPADEVQALEALELQRHAMLMYTSCGWFFDEISGIETVQILQYAGRVIQLLKKTFDQDLEEPFLDQLAEAPSNIPEHRNGRVIFEKWVRPAGLGLDRVMAHFAASSLFEEYEDETKIYSFTIRQDEYEIHAAGRAKLAIGRGRVTSDVTRQWADLEFGVLHLGDHNLHSGVKRHERLDDFQSMKSQLAASFTHADFTQTILELGRFFGESIYSLKSLFRDEQQKVAHTVLQNILTEAEGAYGQLYEYNAPLMRFLSDAALPQPKVLLTAAEQVLNARLKRLLAEDELIVTDVADELDEARVVGVTLDHVTLEFELRGTMERLAYDLDREPDRLENLERLETAADVEAMMPFSVNLFTVQNVAWDIMNQHFDAYADRAEKGEAHARELVDRYRSLNRKLFHFKRYMGEGS